MRVWSKWQLSWLCHFQPLLVLVSVNKLQKAAEEVGEDVKPVRRKVRGLLRTWLS